MDVINFLRNFGTALVLLAVLTGMFGVFVAGMITAKQAGAAESVASEYVENGFTSSVGEVVSDESSAGQVSESDELVRHDVVRVVGYGDAEASNDTGTISLNVEVRGHDYGDVGKSLHELLEAVARVMEVSGVAGAGIETMNASVRKEYEGRRDGLGNWEEVFIGYRGYGTLGARVDDVAVVSKVIGAVYETYDDATVTVGGFRFYLEDDSVVEREAREEAVTHMRLKAEQLAYFSGRTLGRLVSISDPPNIAGNSYGYIEGFIEAAGSESWSSSIGSREAPLSFGKSSRGVVVEGVFVLE